MPPTPDAHRGGGRADRQRQAGRRRAAPRGGDPRAARAAAPSGAQPDQNLADLEGADRRQREGRAGAARAWSAHFGLDVVQAYMRHVQDNAEEAVRRVHRRAAATARSLPAGRRRRDRGRRSRIDRAARSAAIDFTGTSPQLDEQLQRAAGGLPGGRALRLPHPGRRRHPAERRLPEAARIVIPDGSMLQSAATRPRSSPATSRPPSASPMRSTARSA